MTRVSTALGLTALVILVNALFGSPFTAPAAAHQPGTQSSKLRLEVESMQPRVVTEDASELAVDVKLTNTSQQAITDIRARLQLGQAQHTADEFRQALTATAPMDYQLTRFRRLTERLEPGQSFRFSVRADLRNGDDGFRLTDPGVYPMLINVNGSPEFGAVARLAAMHLALPVLSAPGSDEGSGGGDRTPVSILWPIASQPRVVSAPFDGTLVLADDGLAEEMRPGGRLDALVAAAESARGNSALLSSMCFAIDPELVSTAVGMARGYRVASGGKTVAGSGKADAQAWLKALRTLVADQCVLPLPFARADLSALSSVSPSLAKYALSHDDALSDALDVTVERDTLWPQNKLSAGALDAISGADKSVLIGSVPGRPGGAPVTVTSNEHSHRVVPYDPLVALGLSPASASPEVAHNSTLAADDRAVLAQNGVAALVFRARFEQTNVPGPLLVAPPRGWSAPVAELKWMLAQIGDLADADIVSPLPARQLLRTPAEAETRPASDGPITPSLSRKLTSTISATNRTLGDLNKAMTEAATQQVTPADVLTPLRNGLLRAASTALPGDQDAGASAAADVERQLSRLVGDVTIRRPGRTISLASGSSPIPVSIQNDLPVDVTVHVTLSNTTGLRPGAVGDQKIAANSSLNLRVPAEALRAGRFTVDVSLSTPGGTVLGTPTRFRLASTEYGVITVIVTATAGGALLLLSGRRIYRRLRSNGAGRE
ncbi:MAG: hypothetical protein GEU86_03205 [Actinophytocola sp.]|nr:hypothetical protein [Actinophytocola sp.]